MFDCKSGQEILRVEGPDATTVLISADHRRLARGNNDGLIIVESLPERSEARVSNWRGACLIPSLNGRTGGLFPSPFCPMGGSF